MLEKARKSAGLTQAEVAERLGVTQAYLSMVERGRRAVSDALAARAVAALEMPPTALPLSDQPARHREGGFLKAALGRLGYPGFSYLAEPGMVNPAEVLMAALDSSDLGARATEALPWVVLTFPDLDWGWLTTQAKLRDRQNRLGYTVELARQAAHRNGDRQLEGRLAEVLGSLEPCRLAREDTLSKESMTGAERAWLRERRPEAAIHWNLLTDLRVEQIEDSAAWPPA